VVRLFISNFMVIWLHQLIFYKES